MLIIILIPAVRAMSPEIHNLIEEGIPRLEVLCCDSLLTTLATFWLRGPSNQEIEYSYQAS